MVTTQSQRYRKHHWKVKREAIEKMGGACVTCGEIDIRVLTVNHLDGGGQIERAKRSSLTAYKDILNGRTDLDIRCMNCNLLYEYERGRYHEPV